MFPVHYLLVKQMLGGVSIIFAYNTVWQVAQNLFLFENIWNTGGPHNLFV